MRRCMACLEDAVTHEDQSPRCPSHLSIDEYSALAAEKRFKPSPKHGVAYWWFARGDSKFKVSYIVDGQTGRAAFNTTRRAEDFARRVRANGGTATIEA
jgi:hypothetical protein